MSHYNQVEQLEGMLLELEDLLQALSPTHVLYSSLIAEVKSIQQSLAEMKRNL